MNRIITSALAVGALALVSSFAPSAASAQMSTGELVPSADGEGFAGSRVAGELAFHTQSSSSGSDLHAFAPSVYGTVRVADFSPRLDLGVDFGLRSIAIAGATDDFRVGNGFVGAHLGIAGDSYRGRVGLGVALPFLNTYDVNSIDDAIALVVSAGAMGALWGYWDLMYVARGFLPIALRGDFEWRDELFFVGGQAGLALFAPVLDGVDDAQLTMQAAAFGGVRPVRGLALGLRLQAVYLRMFGDAPSDDAQVALMPFVRGELGAGFIEGRFLMNLDEPLGPSFDSGRFWALSVTGGADF